MLRFLKQAAIWLFATVFSLLSVVIATLALVALFYDWNDLRRPIARLASAALGRTVSIDGNLNVQLGWTTRIRVEKLAIANAAWAKPAKMVDIGKLSVAVDVRSLLSGPIHLPSLILDRPQVFLARNAKGETNWTFGNSDGRPSSGKGGGSALPVIDEITVNDGSLRMQTPDPTKDMDLALESLTLRQQPPNQDIQLRGSGRYQRQPFTLRLDAGPLAMLQQSGKPYPLDLDLVAGDIAASVAGSIGDPAKMQRLDLRLDVKGDNAADLFPLLGVVLPPTPPYHVKGRLQRRGEAWSFENFNGSLGKSDVRGVVAVDFGGKRPLMTGEIASNRLVLADLAPFIGAPRDTDTKGEPATSQHPGRVLPDQAVDLSRLRAMDANVSFRSERIVTDDVPLDRFAAKVVLDDGTLRLQPLSFGLGAGAVNLDLTLYGARTPVTADIDLQVRQLDLKELMRGSDFAQQSAGVLGGRAKLSAQGTSVASILGSANGQLSLVMTGGSISILLVELAGLDVVESLGFVIEGDKPTPIRCLVADLKATQGVFQTETMVFDTGDTVIIGGGSVDMAAETLNLTMTPYAKDFSPLTLRSPISLGGTFASPDAFPDPVRTGNKTIGEKVLSAVLTPVLGLLPPFDTEVGTDSDCQSLVRRAKRFVHDGRGR